MSKKQDPIDVLFCRLFKSVWFYVILALGISGIIIWKMQPTWEQKNKSKILCELDAIQEDVSNNPVAAYERWMKLQDFVRGKKITNQSTQSSLNLTNEKMDSIYQEVKGLIEIRERSRREEAERVAKAKQEEEVRVAKEKAATEAREALKKKYRNVDQSAKNALASLKRLQAFTEVGVNKLKYSEALGVAWGDIKIFVESPQGQNDYPELSLLLAQAIDFYKEASDDWGKDSVQVPWAKAAVVVAHIDKLVNQ